MGLFKYAEMKNIDLERLDLERRKVKALETIVEHLRLIAVSVYDFRNGQGLD